MVLTGEKKLQNITELENIAISKKKKKEYFLITASVSCGTNSNGLIYCMCFERPWKRWKIKRRQKVFEKLQLKFFQAW